MFPIWFDEKSFSVFGYTGSTLISGILIIVAILSYPISRVVEQKSVYLSIMISILSVVAISFAIYYATDATILTVLMILFAACYALMSVSFLPLALSVVRDQNKVFGVGVFFAGFELPNGILEAVLVQMGIF
jgi:hypothetical protein